MSFKPSPHRGHQAASWSEIPQWLTPPGDQDNCLTIEQSGRAEGLIERLRVWQWGQKHESQAGEGKTACKSMKRKIEMAKMRFSYPVFSPGVC